MSLKTRWKRRSFCHDFEIGCFWRSAAFVSERWGRNRPPVDADCEMDVAWVLEVYGHDDARITTATTTHDACDPLAPFPPTALSAINKHYVRLSTPPARLLILHHPTTAKCASNLLSETATSKSGNHAHMHTHVHTHAHTHMQLSN